VLRVACSVFLVACSLRDPPAARHAAPLPADPPMQLESMQAECDAMIAALTTYKTCENLEYEDRDAIDAWVETANRNFAASRKAKPEPNAQTAIAGACRKATLSVKAATERCLAGPRPKIE
jgi:hypothetical protein